MFKKIISILYLCLFVAFLFGQQGSIKALKAKLDQELAADERLELLLELGNLLKYTFPQEALSHGSNALGLANQLQDLQKQGEAYHLTGHVQLRQGNYLTAIEHLNRAAYYFKSSGDKALLVESYRHLGYAHSRVGERAENKAFYDKAQALVDIIGKEHPQAAKLYSNWGIYYQSEGNYDLASRYFINALRIHQKTNNKRGLATVYLNYGVNFANLRDIENASNYFQKARDLFASIEDPFAEGVCKINVGSVHKSYHVPGEGNHHLEAARKEYFGACEIFREYNNSRRIAYAYANIADTYLIELENTKSIQYYDTAIFYSNLIQDAQRSSVYYSNQAQLFERIGDTLSALKAFHHAVISSVKEPQDSSIFTNPRLENIISIPVLLNALSSKARVMRDYYVVHPNEVEYIETAWDALNLSAQLIDSIKQNLAAEEDLLVQIKYQKEILEYILDAAFLLFGHKKDQRILERALSIIEGNKSTLLYTQLKQAQAFGASRIPQTLLSEQSKLKLALVKAAKKLKELTLDAPLIPDSVLIRVDGEYREALDAYKAFLLELEEAYPSYYDLNYNIQSPNIEDIQEALNKQEVIVEYFWGKEYLYFFSITKSDLNLHRQVRDTTLDHQLNMFYKLLGDPNHLDLQPQKTFNDFIAFGENLYRQLVGPIEPIVKDKKLIIIPDSILNFLPFEVLLTESYHGLSGQYKNLPYLIKRNQVHYASTASLWLETKIRKVNFKGPFRYLAFLPRSMVAGNISSSGLPSVLPNSLQQHKSIQTQIFAGDRATKENFKGYFQAIQSAPLHILHISTHNELDLIKPLNTSLRFAPLYEDLTTNKLFLFELFGMNIPAELVVLGACETNRGAILSGEGGNSLSRGFTYAGAKSVLSSLWKVGDESTSQVSLNFFKYLAEGKSKSEALQMAKLGYLETCAEPWEAPHYWAGMVLNGDDRIIIPDQNSKHWLTIFGFVLGIFALLYILFRLKKTI